MISLTLITSCSKSEQFVSTKISGSVINGISQEVFSRGTIELIETETPPEPFTPIIERVFDEQEIQNDGTYSIQFNAKRGSRFSYRAQISYPEGEMFGSGTHNDNKTIESISIEKKGEHLNQNFIIYPYCRFKVLLYNDNEFDATDEITVHSIHNILGTTVSAYYQGDGGYDNDSFNERKDFIETLSGKRTLEWHVTRNGSTSVFTDEIILEHNEERIYEIHY